MGAQGASAIGLAGNEAGRLITAAVIGFTVSELTGGKFANGAASASFAAALSTDWDGKATVGDTAKSDVEENRKALQSELDQLAESGIVSRSHFFVTADDAAK